MRGIETTHDTLLTQMTDPVTSCFIHTNQGSWFTLTTYNTFISFCNTQASLCTYVTKLWQSHTLCSSGGFCMLPGSSSEDHCTSLVLVPIPEPHKEQFGKGTEVQESLCAIWHHRVGSALKKSRENYTQMLKQLFTENVQTAAAEKLTRFSSFHKDSSNHPCAKLQILVSNSIDTKTFSKKTYPKFLIDRQCIFSCTPTLGND